MIALKSLMGKKKKKLRLPQQHSLPYGTLQPLRTPSTSSPLRKWLIAGALLLFCALTKWPVADHGLPSDYTNDVQPFWKALEFNSILHSGKPAAHLDFEEAWSHPKEPPKYPLGLTQIYLKAWSLTSPKEFTDFLLSCRHTHILLCLLAAGLVMALPLDPRLRLLALGLLSVSLITHQFSLVMRVHAPAGYFVFGTCLCSLKALGSPRPWLWTVLGGASAGMATSIFFTGAVAFAPVLAVAPLRQWKGTLALKPALLTTALGLLAGLLVFSHHYPTLGQWISGKSPIINTGEFGKYTGDIEGKSPWSPAGFLEYANDIFGMDPLLYLGYLAGLFLLWRRGEWKEPQWLLILLTAIPYQLLMGFMSTNQVRRSSMVMHAAAIVSAYAWLKLWNSRRQTALFLITVLGLWNTASILKFNQLLMNDTRTQAHAFVRKHVPPGSGILSDHLGPRLDAAMPGETLHGFKFVDSRSIPEDTEIAKMPSLMQGAGLGYYLRNQNWQRHKACLDSSTIVAVGKLVGQWSPCPGKKDPNWGWPGSSDWAWPNNSDWLLWRMWGSQAGGPTVELFEMPWAPQKIAPQVPEGTKPYPPL